MKEGQARPLTEKEKEAKQPPIIDGMGGQRVYVGKRGILETVAKMVDSLVEPRARRF